MGGTFGKIGDAMKSTGGGEDEGSDSPLWANMLKGGLGGAAKGLQNMQQPQGGAPVQFDSSQPQLPGDFYQPPDYLNQAKKRLGAFYGGGGY